MKKHFDVGCLRLAEKFLEDLPPEAAATEAETEDLAATIQETIEEWLRRREEAEA